MKVTSQPQTGSVQQGSPQASAAQQPADTFSERCLPISSADAVESQATTGPALAAPVGPSDETSAAPPGAMPAMVQATKEHNQTLRTLAPGDVAGNLNAQIQLIQSSATQLAAAVTSVSTLVGGTNPDIYTNASTILTDLSGTAANIQGAVDALSTILVNNTNYASALCTQAANLGANIDNSLTSLPGGATYATILSVASSDGSGGVNITFSGLGASSGTYNLPSAAIAGGIANGGAIAFTNGGDQIVLHNRSGSLMTTQAQVIRYLASMYPVSTELAADLADGITSVKTMLGGSGSSVRSRIAAVDGSLLQWPTGVLANDLATARGELVASPGANLEADIESVNALVDGTTTGSTTVARLDNVATSVSGSSGGNLAAMIGAPSVNGSASSLAGVIGGAAADIATSLGDPITPGSGLASLVNASQATDNNALWSGGVGNLVNATNLNDQLVQFLALFGSGALTSAPNGQIVFQLSSTPPTSLGALIGLALSTQ